jgi:hypothetical protein
MRFACFAVMSPSFVSSILLLGDALLQSQYTHRPFGRFFPSYIITAFDVLFAVTNFFRIKAGRGQNFAVFLLVVRESGLWQKYVLASGTFSGGMIVQAAESSSTGEGNANR